MPESDYKELFNFLNDVLKPNFQCHHTLPYRWSDVLFKSECLVEFELIQKKIIKKEDWEREHLSQPTDLVIHLTIQIHRAPPNTKS